MATEVCLLLLSPSPCTGYYDDDDDAMGVGTVEASDATFQLDPEFYLFHCLSTEETWNYLDSQVRDVSQKLKVWRMRERERGRGEGPSPG